MSMVAAEAAAGGEAAGGSTVTRDKLLADPRSGAKPLGGSDPGPGQRPSASPAPSKPRSTTPRSDSGERSERSAPSRPAPSRPASSDSGSKSKGPKIPKSISFGSVPSNTNYQTVIIVEFVAAELLVAATPIATKPSQPGLSPYAPTDMTKMIAIGLVYFILSMLAAANASSARISAWFGGLVLIGVGLLEASHLGNIFQVLSGGSGKSSISTMAAIAQKTSQVNTVLGQIPQLSVQGSSNSSTTTGTKSGPGSSGGTGSKSGGAFVADAAKFIGTPYLWGGESPRGFDCSGLVDYVLTKMGLSGVPRTSEEQWAWVQKISQSQLQPGDLIFEQWPGEVSPGHVAIYAGGGEIIQAPAPGQKVQRVKWSPSIVRSQGGSVVGYGRVPGLNYGGSNANVI